MSLPVGLISFKTIYFHFTDINAKEDELRNTMNHFRKGIGIIEIDNMTHLESLYEELLITSNEFKLLIISKPNDLKKYNYLHRLFVDKYNLIKEFINLYY